MIAQKYIVNVEAAIYKDDKWLLGKRSEHEDYEPGVISLIGGKVEIVENKELVLENELKREILEESGVEIFDEIIYVKSNVFMMNVDTPVLDVVFLCRYKKGTPTDKDPNEIISFDWHSLEDLKNNKNIKSWTKDSINQAFIKMTELEK